MKPWPTDSVVVVAPPSLEANYLEMIDPQPGTCHDCGTAILCCSYSRDKALALPERQGRPLLYLCPACAAQYHFDPAGVLHDLRGQDFNIHIGPDLLAQTGMSFDDAVNTIVPLCPNMFNPGANGICLTSKDAQIHVYGRRAGSNVMVGTRKDWETAGMKAMCDAIDKIKEQK